MNQPIWHTDLTARFIREGRTKVLGVVLHDTAGAGSHNDTRYLANPSDGRKVSVDFTVEPDGSIWKLNPDLSRYYCSHAGRNTKFKGFVNGQVNRVTIGIEICQKVKLPVSGPIYPDPQVRSVAELVAWLITQFKLTTSDITTHRQIITDGSRSDPRKFPFDGEKGFWTYYWNALGKGEEHVVSQEIKKTPDAEVAERTYVVSKGDTLSAIAKKFYGKTGLFTLIQAANNLKSDVIIPGQVLIVPEVK